MKLAIDGLQARSRKQNIIVLKRSERNLGTSRQSEFGVVRQCQLVRLVYNELEQP